MPERLATRRDRCWGMPYIIGNLPLVGVAHARSDAINPLIMLCLVHGYSLTGSGSNQWCRSIAEGMATNGETVQLVCQEHRPAQFDFVSEAFTYGADGIPVRDFSRDVPYSGACIVHRPELDLLPTYVRPQASNTYMASILDLSETQVDEYLRRNERVLAHVVDQHDVTAVQVNHVVLMAVAVARVCGERGIPFGILPHGSAIEYIVKHDERSRRLASDALSSASTIFTLSDELRVRIRSVFPDVESSTEKMTAASAGVDTSRFQLVDRTERAKSIAALTQHLHDVPRGKTGQQRARLREALRDEMDLDEMLQIIGATSDHPAKLPDETIEKDLRRIDWLRDEVIAFVGKIIGYKGLPALVAAFPRIASAHPRARLLIAGRGNLRGGLEALVYALADGKRHLVERIVDWGGAVEGEAQAPFERVRCFLGSLDRRGELDAYFEEARQLRLSDRIIFTGYLEHDLLRYLFPCCDVAIFPSIVKEAAPLVVPEAMASGCFPIGTDYAGMAASLDVASEAVPEDVGRLMRLRHDPRWTVHDIVEHVPPALDAALAHREALRDVAVRRYDWRSVAATMAADMRRMTAPSVRGAT